MSQYNFKRITVVPNAPDFVNIVLSRTNRKTPTVVHPNYQISRIRRFYMRKVKFTQMTIHEKLSMILEEFPRLEDIHPFFADLMNILYDKDHYKLALGQLNTARNLVDAVGRDYVRLLKYGDSLFRCKQLKRAALGRMVTILKKQHGSLAYLEQVRQHLARLPAIDPSTRTLILTGYPNVGKSSLMNKLTRANVDVQPYAFTTKSLFVGHTDYKYLRWQVIDTPGILDHPLEDRNTIEMMAITALAHLRACVLFLIDLSEHCGYSLEQQVSLFHNIRPLFAGKPLVVVFSKIDLVRFEQLDDDQKKLLNSITDNTDGNVTILGMSNLTEEGIPEVKQRSCDILLEHRVEAKMSKQHASGSKQLENILNRIHLAMPKPRRRGEVPADDHDDDDGGGGDEDDEMAMAETEQWKPPQTFIPESVLNKRQTRGSSKSSGGDVEMVDLEDDEVLDRLLEKDLEALAGGNTNYNPDLRKRYDLRDGEWKYDTIPEFMDGKNVADFIDPEIMAKLDELEREEEERARRVAASGEINYATEDVLIDPEELDLFNKIDAKKKLIMLKNKAKTKHKARLPMKYRVKDLDAIAAELISRGVDEEALDRARSRTMSVSRARTTTAAGGSGVSRGRSVSEMRVLQERANSSTRTESVLGKRKRLVSQTDRSISRSIKDPRQQIKAVEMARKKQKPMQLDARRGESDRGIMSVMPKHLFSGKRSFATDRR